MSDYEDYVGWVPDEEAAKEETFAAFAASVGGIGDWDPKQMPPVVSYKSIKGVLEERASELEKLVDENYWAPPWEIARYYGIAYPIANQGSYSSCSPYNSTKALDDLDLYAKAQTYPVKCESMSGWYSYVLTWKKYGGSKTGGRTMAVPARLAREVGRFRESVVGAYSKIAGNYKVEEKDDPEANKYRGSYCSLAGLSVKEHAEAILLALRCRLVVANGSDRQVVNSGKTVGGLPLGKRGRATMHAQNCNWCCKIDNKWYVTIRNSWGKVSPGGNAGFPQDCLLLSYPDGVQEYIGGRYRDGIIYLGNEFQNDMLTPKGLPDLIEYPSNIKTK